MPNKIPAFSYFLKYHFFNGLKDLAVTWLIVTIINQFVFFGACLQPYCILASIPHCLLISVGIVFFIFKNDWNEYTNKGFNKFGFDADGYNTEGFNIEGYNRDGYNSQGYDRRGCDQDGYNNIGFDLAGYDKDGYNNKGFNRKGFDNQGYNLKGLDVDGFNAKGYANGYDRNNITWLKGWWINRFKDKNYFAQLKKKHNSKLCENYANKVFYDYLQIKRLKESEENILAASNPVKPVEPAPVVKAPSETIEDQLPLVLNQDADDIELPMSDEDDEPLSSDRYGEVIPPWQYEPEDDDEETPVWANNDYKAFLKEPPPPLLIPQLNADDISSVALDRSGEVGRLYISLWDSALAPTYYKKDWSNLDILLFYTQVRNREDKAEIAALFTKLWLLALVKEDIYQEDKRYELFDIIRHQPENNPD